MEVSTTSPSGIMPISAAAMLLMACFTGTWVAYRLRTKSRTPHGIIAMVQNRTMVSMASRRGLRNFLWDLASCMSFAARVLSPVASALSSSRPEMIVIPESSRSPAVRWTSSLSPVCWLSSTSPDPLVTVPSQGTWSPCSSTTTIPGSSPSRVTVRPSAR